MTKNDYAGTPAFELSKREFLLTVTALALSGVASWTYAIVGLVR